MPLGLAPSPVKRFLSTESTPKSKTIVRVGAYQLAQFSLVVVGFILFGPVILIPGAIVLEWLSKVVYCSFRFWCWLLEFLGIIKD